MRDYIPEGEGVSAVERERFTRQRAAGGSRPDFIPGPDHKLAPRSGHAAQAKEALDRAMAAQGSAARADWDAGVLKLKNLNVGQAIEAIRQAPFAVQEMLLTIEMKHGQRSSILKAFPKVDPSVVENWDSILADAPASDEDGEENEDGSS